MTYKPLNLKEETKEGMSLNTYFVIATERLSKKMMKFTERVQGLFL